ncbi:MAG: DUF29 domain-containing protein [Pseudomonadota bacterium]
MGALYDGDVVAWAYEQAALLRAGRWSELDIDNIAEEIESVARTERRELKTRMALLLAHLLKWQMQPSLRGKSWLRTIRLQRSEIHELLRDMPSLRPSLQKTEWLSSAWEHAVGQASVETGLQDFPESMCWSVDQILDPNFFPD